MYDKLTNFNNKNSSSAHYKAQVDVLFAWQFLPEVNRGGGID
jgi:hypothetical protein